MRRLGLLGLSAIASLAISTAWVGSAAGAAPTFTQNALRVSVSGGSVSVVANVGARSSTLVDGFGLCAKNASGASVPFGTPAAATITSRGVTTRATQSLTPGTYSIVPCVSYRGSWQNVGASKSATVAGTASPDSGRWTPVYSEDFSRNAATGQVQAVYGENMNGYRDKIRTTYGNYFNTDDRVYHPSKVLSVHDGALDFYLHSEGGVHMSAAPVPQGWANQTYGRYSVRMKADAVEGYKTAFLLWPESGDWGGGEIDFPEAGLAERTTGAVHKLSPGDPNQFVKVTAATTYADWHTYTTEWYPGHVRMLIDGVLLKDFTADVPTTPHYWVLQVETDYAEPTDSAQGHLLVDSVSVDAYNG